LFRKYEGADKNETLVWQSAIKDASCSDTWRRDLSDSVIFGHFIQKANGASKPYSLGKTGAFTLLRYVVMHAGDCTVS